MKKETKLLLERFKLLCEDDVAWEALNTYLELMSLPEEEVELIQKEAQVHLTREKFKVIEGDRQ